MNGTLLSHMNDVIGNTSTTDCQLNMSLQNMSSNNYNPLQTSNSSSLYGINCSEPPYEMPPSVGYPVLVLEFAKILYGIVFLVGLFGNTLVIYVVCRFSKMQTVTNMYIFNLAVADEMFLVGLPFLITTVIYKYWSFGRIMCKIYMTTTSINQFTSSLLLTVMSADRYVAVCHPISSPRYRTPFIAKFICLTVWTVSALLMVPIFMYANTLELPTTISCNIFWPESDLMNGEKAFTLYTFTLGFFIPFVLILLFYFLVICKLRKVGPKNRSKEKKRSHRKVTYLVLTVISVYVMCWLPYWIGQVYITFLPPAPNHRHSEASLTFILLAGCLSYANSAVNPILYAFLSENFKKSFGRAFTCVSVKEVNAQLNVENSVFPKSTRGSTKTTARKSKNIDDNGETQGFSNFVLHESNIEHQNDIDLSTAFTMTSRSQCMPSQEKDSLFNNGYTEASISTHNV
ncbi:somatostatin receptor type 5-like [Oppia nitens]|uniref:somatostatin receptor type 5-like n=1 Tax=Oppia nitens TaxID=1686743 RepID=UPI0023DB5248|nr:somatostatin receptor type 5-like [Oppia nitens]